MDLFKKGIFSDLGVRIPSGTSCTLACSRCRVSDSPGHPARSRGLPGVVYLGFGILGTDNPNQISKPVLFVLEAVWDGGSGWLGQD